MLGFPKALNTFYNYYLSGLATSSVTLAVPKRVWLGQAYK